MNILLPNILEGENQHHQPVTMCGSYRAQEYYCGQQYRTNRQVFDLVLDTPPTHLNRKALLSAGSADGIVKFVIIQDT